MFAVVGGLLGNVFIGIPSLVLIVLLILPIAFVRGFIGRNDIVNGCMNCGNKWVAGKE